MVEIFGWRCPAAHLGELHKGDVDELSQTSNFISDVVSVYLMSSTGALPQRPTRALPKMEDVLTWPESGLGKLMVSASAL